MGLIEQAAKGLEELRRTGIELPDGLRIRGATEEASELRAPVRPASPIPEGHRTVEPRALVPKPLPPRRRAGARDPQAGHRPPAARAAGGRT